jgi:uncharacterized membrane protein (UPF0127 family)
LLQAHQEKQNLRRDLFAPPFFPLQAIWPNNEITIIDISTANPWGLYWPREAARHLIETPARNPLQVFIGEKLEVRYV